VPTLEQSHEYEIVSQHDLALLAETNEIEHSFSSIAEKSSAADYI
jgi:hypothetical protein